MDERDVDVVEERDDVCFYSGEYLTAAAHMVAWQLIDDDINEYPDKEAVADRIEYLYRQHCPMVYAYFFTNNFGDNGIQSGVVDIVLTVVWNHRPDFIGGREVNGTKVTL